MKIRDLIGTEKVRQLVVSVSSSPLEAWMSGVDFHAVEDVIITTKTAKKVKVAKKVKKVKVAKKVKTTTRSSKKSLIAALRKEVRRAIQALSWVKARCTLNRVHRNLRAEKALGWEGLQLLDRLQEEVSRDKREQTVSQMLATWAEAQSKLRPLYRVCDYSGLSY